MLKWLVQPLGTTDKTVNLVLQVNQRVQAAANRQVPKKKKGFVACS